MLLLLQFKSNRSDGKAHSSANLDGQPARIVGNPDQQFRFAREQHAIEDEGFITNGVERSGRRLYLLALLGVEPNRYSLLAIAELNLSGLAGFQLQCTHFVEAADHVADAGWNVDLRG